MISPTGDGDDFDWFVRIDYQPTGYIRDGEKGKLKADKLLRHIKDDTDHANEERRRKGWTQVHVVGWMVPPFYDDTTKNMTWGVLGTEDDAPGQIMSYTVQALGRRGTMKIRLETTPEQIKAALPYFNKLVSGFSYNEGNRYADFAQGDTVAEYGLTALIAGGVGAAAVKTGVLAKVLAALWKVILLVLAAVAIRVKRARGWFKRKFGAKEETGGGG